MNKKGFTLIELLAVIIILGILMIIAIPSVTKYISDSRKNAYVDSAKEIIGGARNIVNEGKLEMYDTDTTYYIESACIKTENALKSPYDDFDRAYVVVTYDGKGYTYYWTSVDKAGQGIKDIVRFDKLDIDNVESDLTSEDIALNRGIDGRSKVVLITDRNNCKKEGAIDAGPQINGETGASVERYVCKRATELKTRTCHSPDNYCYSAYTDLSVGQGITFGTLGSGEPQAGDAYDCDVNGDGVFDSDLERFYYLTNNGDKAVLLYYTNVVDGEPDLEDNGFYYNENGSNLFGPITAYEQLPSTSQWSNNKLLLPGTRQIYTHDGGTIVYNGNRQIETFTYTNKAARFLTTQELSRACYFGNDYYSSNTLQACPYLFDGVGFFKRSAFLGYWLENVNPGSTYNAWTIDTERKLQSHDVDRNPYYGVRPVIDVLLSDIEH